MSSSPTLACSRWCSSSRASGARLFSPAWPAARNWSRHWEARAAVIPQFPRHRLEILASQQAEYRRAFTPGRKPPLPVTLGGRSSRPPGALRRRRFFNLLPHLDTPPARTLSQSSVQENSRAQEWGGVVGRHGRGLPSHIHRGVLIPASRGCKVSSREEETHVSPSPLGPTRSRWLRGSCDKRYARVGYDAALSDTTPSQRSRSSRFNTLPLGFLGSASRNTTRLGTLNPARCARQCAMTSASVTV